jgi:hypothetical protein
VGKIFLPLLTMMALTFGTISATNDTLPVLDHQDPRARIQNLFPLANAESKFAAVL